MIADADFHATLAAVSDTAPHLAYLYSRYPVVSQTFCDTEMLALESMGFRLTIGSLNPPPASFRHERLAGLKAEIIYPPPRPVLDLPLHSPPADTVWQEMAALAAAQEIAYGKSFKSLTRARNAWFFSGEFRRRGIRHLHVHFANRATHTALFLKKAGFTFSFTAHAQDFMVDLGSHHLLREMAHEAEFVVAVSDFSRDLLAGLCPDAGDKILRIYNGLDPAAFKLVAAPAAPPLRVLSVGRLIDFKGFPDLIEAVRLLRDRGVDVLLDIVGEGPQRSALERQIENENLSGCIRLLGVQSQDQVRNLLDQCQVFALACITDSKGASDILPTVILEAMAAGRPVVSTRLVGVPEMVEDGVTGLLAAPGDAAAMARHLLRLAGDAALRDSMGLAGRRKLETTFTLQQTAGRLAEKFRTVAPQSPPSEKAPPVLGLIETWPDSTAFLTEEMAQATSTGKVALLGARCSSALENSPQCLPIGMEFLPDAIVLESAWRYAPHLAAKAEALYAHCGPVDGEVFFQEARRAVFTVQLAERRGIRHVHAFRSGSMLWAWLVSRLAGITASFAVEPHPLQKRSLLEKLLPDFAFGSVSDEKLAAKLGNAFPDDLKLAGEKRKASWFARQPAPQQRDFSSVWQVWLGRILS